MFAVIPLISYCSSFMKNMQIQIHCCHISYTNKKQMRRQCPNKELYSLKCKIISPRAICHSVFIEIGNDIPL